MQEHIVQIRLRKNFGIETECTKDFADFHGTKQYNMWIFIMRQIDFSKIDGVCLVDALKDFAKNFSYTWDDLSGARSPRETVICAFSWQYSGLGDGMWGAIDEAYKAMIRDLNLHDEYSTPWKKC